MSLPEPPRARRPFWVTVTLLALSGALVVGFVLLGNWQLRRLGWKLDLIEAVETRAFGDPVPLPEAFDPDTHEYLRVRVDATPLDAVIFVKAVTELGGGHWAMQAYDVAGEVLWVNRGFVLADERDPALWPEAPRQITGLLRATQPEGTALESNDPVGGRWVSRDTIAMSNALGLGETRPYFLDADDLGPAGQGPRGGMTIVAFRNSHLSYALTWYAMALLFAGAIAYLIWSRDASK